MQVDFFDSVVRTGRRFVVNNAEFAKILPQPLDRDITNKISLNCVKLKAILKFVNFFSVFFAESFMKAAIRSCFRLGLIMVKVS